MPEIVNTASFLGFSAPPRNPKKQHCPDTRNHSKSSNTAAESADKTPGGAESTNQNTPPVAIAFGGLRLTEQITALGTRPPIWDPTRRRWEGQEGNARRRSRAQLGLQTERDAEFRDF